MALTKAKLEELITAGDVDPLVTLLAGKCVMKAEWTNLSPTASFEAQTITKDLSAYDAVLVLAMVSTTAQNQVAAWAFLGAGGVLYYAGAANRARLFTPSTTGIAFESGTLYSTYGTGTPSGASLVPYKIIGIKFSV